MHAYNHLQCHTRRLTITSTLQVSSICITRILVHLAIGCGVADQVKTFLPPSLIAMQNLAALCRTYCVGGSKKLGGTGALTH